MAQIPKLLSKTKIMQGYQCHKNLYLSVHNKELIPPVTPDLQALFDQGVAVTEEARKRYPKGVLVDFPAYDFIGSLKKTRELLAAKTEHIFEAAFEYKGCYARADIISYNPLTERWSICEVKSSTKVKDEHLQDVGLQAWIMANAGLPIEKISILHLNSSCQFPNLQNLFTEVDVTEKLREDYLKIAPRLNDIFSSLRAEKVPVVDLGEHCFNPRECQFFSYCCEQKKIPETSLFDIPTLREKKWELYRKKQIALEDIDPSELSESQRIFLQVLKSGKRHVDSQKIKDEIKTWKFPLVFLDFETINPAIPKYKKTTAFQQVPFQYSIHILKDLDSEPEHLEFLYDVEGDPRSLLAETLANTLAREDLSESSVVAYYSRFEAERLQELADFVNDSAVPDKLLSIKKRLVDPLPILREAVYDKAFGDSFSIKKTGPALLGDAFDYAGLQVGDGSAAQRAYNRLILLPKSSQEHETLKKALLEYCKKDTFVLVELVKWLFEC